MPLNTTDFDPKPVFFFGIDGKDFEEFEQHVATPESEDNLMRISASYNMQSKIK